MHGRLHVESDAQGKGRVVAVEVVGGETAPKPFVDCVDRVLKQLELDLEPGTSGLVVTPPFAGER
ncbi:hypothetical protein HPC49_32095 [Pyxidicoccus fallax]|uniref:Uncharacterized protein n=1 Tax=Pyxidicoccus fallax TaxID=394095 RepID=A0A848LRK4_9BACT|nr:hypothetical protein [Pyxidicoccus fallax]NMO20557.1 hypothetical protein [Pyxidicoccus fallax]NPC82853.1 hypothetical protein [Pyxidicoccus fallax]